MTDACMHAARVTKHGDVEAVEWTTVPRPEPAAGEVRVRVAAAGMNHLDLWVRRGVAGHRFPLPLILGSDGAGVVDAAGTGVESVALGSEVILAPAVSCESCPACESGDDPMCRQYSILGEDRDGTCAEFVVVPASCVFPKPDSVDWATAAAFPLATLTAWTMLIRRAALREGETVLVLAGTSGVGNMAIQIARLHGCRVIATAGGPEKCARLVTLGADEVIDHGSEDITQRVRELTAKRGVDIVFEHVGAATWADSLRSLARGGRLVTCGATTGPGVELDLRLIFYKRLSILGSTMGARADLPHLIERLGAGELRPLIGARLPMAEVRDAHRLLEERQVTGKVVLLPDRDAKGTPA